MLKLKNISKTYSTKDGVTHRALNNISLEFESKGLVFILGKSGSGKSTLLNIIGGLDSFDRGEIYLYGKKFSKFKKFEYDFYRNTFTGFVFQEYNLINELTIEENVTLALDLQSIKDKDKIDKIFDDLEISELKNRKVFALSGGQKQRVAIARALVKNPSIILADEPTGALDTNTTKEIFDLLIKLSKERLVIVITHNREIAELYGDRVIELKDGEVLKDLTTEINDEEDRPSLIASSVFKVPKNAKFGKDELKKLNEILSSEKIDHYISFETNQNKVKSMFPHLKEAINTNEENKEKFKQYSYKEEVEEEKEVKLIKSKLPFKRGIKFGLSNLKVKIPRLIFSLFLAIFSITLSGCVDNFANFDEYKAISNTIKHYDLNNVMICSSYDENYYLRENDLRKINEINEKEAPLIFERRFNITNYDLDMTYILSNSLNRAIECEDISDLSYEYLATSNKEYGSEGVVISEVVAREIYRVHSGFSSINDVLDLDIDFNGLSFIIEGIYKCDELDKYDVLRKGEEQLSYLKDEYNSKFYNYYSNIFVKEGFVDLYKSKIEESNEFFIDSFYGDTFISVNKIKLLKNEVINSVSSGNGVYLTTGLLDSLMVNTEYDDYEDFINYLNSQKKEFTIYLNRNICYISDELVIKGYEVNNDDNVIYFDDDLFEIVKDFSLKATGAFIQLNGRNILNIVKDVYNNGYVIYESFASDYENIKEIFVLLGSILAGINNVIFILAIILLFSFIHSSVKNNVRQIGILRAIGANVIDIIKIYVIEALIIGIASLLFSLIIYGVGGYFINLVIGETYLSIFTFGFSTVMKMISSTLIVVGLSLIIPIIKITRMHPVDAIRSDK